MCREVSCRTCGRSTWAGCGRHVAHVRAQVGPFPWCPGHGEGDLLLRRSPAATRLVVAMSALVVALFVAGAVAYEPPVPSPETSTSQEQ